MVLRSEQQALLRKKFSLARRRGQKARQHIFPAPVDGLNTRDPQQSLPASEASKLVNWIPTEEGLISRRGRQVFASATVGELGTIHTWDAGTATSQLLVADNSIVYRILSATGSFATIGTGFNSRSWHGKMAGGNLYIASNSNSDRPQQWDGATLTAVTWNASTTGTQALTPERLCGFHVFKQRGYWWDRESLNFWYGASADVVAVNVERFPLETIAQHGGFIVSINSYTQDGGAGPEDFLVITTSKGEVLIYQGTAPNAADWAIVGRYRIPEPVSKRAFLEQSGKILVLTG
jgi:hypothetical protein